MTCRVQWGMRDGSGAKAGESGLILSSLGYTDIFRVAGVTSTSHQIVTVALVTVWSSIRELKDPFEFDMEHGIVPQTMQENLASSCIVRKDS